MTVLDASVLVSALLDSDETGEWARHFFAIGPVDVPEIAFVETTNSLRRLELRGEIPGVIADAALSDLLQMEVERHTFAAHAERVWEMRHRLTAYDACYVALAESFGGRLATLDRRLARTAGDFCEVISPGPPGAAGG